MDERAFAALYGRWEPLAPHELRDLLAGAAVRWWIAGGVALELAGARPRPHDDLDVAVLLDDLPALRERLASFHLWEAHDGTLRPLLPGESLREGREQLWLRRDASQPWLADLVLTPSEGGRWLFKKDRRLSRPLGEIGGVHDGIPYLRPELVLLHKAHLRREKDEADFAAALPLLDSAARRWLAGALRRYLPGHPWAAALR
jgi:hypothetical protein